MPKRRTRNRVSKRLVIDATIVRAAGGEDAVHPTSKRCRDFLIDVLTICHHAIMPPELREEWKEHQSKFTRRWRRQMTGKKKLHGGAIQRNDQLRDSIANAIHDPTPREAAQKDAHLIEAALVGNQIVVSLDERAREAFSTASRDVRVLTGIVWVNPSKPDEDATAWLHTGAPDDAHRKLGAR